MVFGCPAPGRVDIGAAPTAPDEQHRDRLAALMLDAYRDTIDDDGESLDDALNAVDYYLASIVRPHSHVVLDGDDIAAFAFVVVVNGVAASTLSS